MTEPPQLEDFPYQDYDKLRYDDMDTVGHVSNVVFATILGTGRVGMLNHPGINAWTHDSLTYVIARLDIDYRGELMWPGTVQVGTAVKSVGKTSISLTQALYQAQKCVATGTSVMVQVDKHSHRPVPVSDETRAILTGLMLKAPA